MEIGGAGTITGFADGLALQYRTFHVEHLNGSLRKAGSGAVGYQDSLGVGVWNGDGLYRLEVGDGWGCLI
jgi:hypothetical protein